MKKHSILLLSLALGIAQACDDFSFLQDKPEQGILRWSLDSTSLPTKAAREIPDTNDFLLTIRDGGGKVLYDGSYGDAPEQLQVDEGSYTLTLLSIPFTSPAFSRPQYGDEQLVLVPRGQKVDVRLHCTLQNAGVRLKINPNFLESAYRDGILYLKQDDVKLKYQYAEQRIAYFRPGEVSLLLYDGGDFVTLLTRELSAREILTLQISAPQSSGTGASQLSVQLDTSKTWLTEAYVIGGDNGSGNSPSPDAVPVGSAAAHIGETLWLYGYIVGGDLTSAGKEVKTSGIGKNTHIALADRSSVTAKASCVAVELPKGSVRDALNLVDHPDLIGTRVYVKGTLTDSYFGTLGLKGTNDFVLK